MVSWLRKLFGSADNNATASRTQTEPEQPFIVNLFDDRVVVHRPDGQREELEWRALERVVARVSRRAPWTGRAWLILVGEERPDGRQQGCVTPLDAVNHEALLSRLRALPGFDQALLDNALRDARNGRTREDVVCWQRGDAAVSGANAGGANDDPAHP
ncbi:hypothetical protein [Cupriavidus sp. UGS-1]|uniref:hypothetical protein n=1 Tax=Cupriavidus sp. UGS-1 TaxID=2899826 RepID=UPI001E605C14|nr:hypothetical protein [Cupriavidus sp. UGS-1]MCD9122867.1 hypothetical protein [Cupriavidus sp. UGS-1]